MFRKAAVLSIPLFSIWNTPVLAAPLAAVEKEGNPWWLWLIVFAALALFAGFMLWWWLSEPEEEEETTATRHDQAEVYRAPHMPEAAAPDDLTIVEGIGPAIQKILYAAGINTYRDLAAAGPDRLEAILEEADAKLARLFDPTTWPEQAQLAADGNWEQLEALKNRLNAGRRA